MLAKTLAFFASMFFFSSVLAQGLNEPSTSVFLKKEPAEKTIWYGGLVAKMIYFYGQACSNGEGDGCFNLAAIYDTGDESVKDKFKALKYYKQACETGHALACNTTGVLYAQGEGTETDLNIAQKYFDQSCKLQEAFGCKNLAIGSGYQRKN